MKLQLTASGFARKLSKLALTIEIPEWLLLRRHGVPQQFYLQMKANWWKAFRFDTIVDIGANTGQFVYLARHLFREAQVLAFEPQRDAFEMLERNTRKLGNVRCFNIACGAEDTDQVLFSNEFGPASSLRAMEALHQAAFPYASAIREEPVHVKRLDDLLKPYVPLGQTLVKMDVQGFEDQVIAGGRLTIGQASAVIAEVSFVPLYQGQPLFGDIFSSLTGLGLHLAGFIDQLLDPRTGQPLQADAVFTRHSTHNKSLGQ